MHKLLPDCRYNVQLDVLKQLEQRLREQILAQRKTSSNESTKQTLIKLERDFERVQATAQSYKSKVTRQQKQFQQRGGGNALSGSYENNNAATTLQQEQARFQMQVQEDVSYTDPLLLLFDTFRKCLSHIYFTVATS